MGFVVVLLAVVCGLYTGGVWAVSRIRNAHARVLLTGLVTALLWTPVTIVSEGGGVAVPAALTLLQPPPDSAAVDRLFIVFAIGCVIGGVAELARLVRARR